ncbi:MAG TPA: GntR family transcriptional regulator [Pseudonocardia sp.]
MKLSPTSGHPYQALAAAVAAKIRRGDLKPDERLPPIRVLAKEYEVTMATAQRAVQHLAMTGYVRSMPNVGSFVLPAGDRSTVPTTVEEVNDRVDELHATIGELRKTVDELASRLDKVDGGGNPVV